MKEFTKYLKNEMDKDIKRITRRNHTKDNNRTQEQIEQSNNDKYNYYVDKWNGFVLDRKCETKTQYDICATMIDICIKYLYKKGELA